MGGKGGSKVQVTQYYESMHYGVCIGPVDAFREIRYGDKVFWTGIVSDQEAQHVVNNELFGGLKKEGGVEGYVTFLPGKSDQVLPAGLAGRLTGKSPAETPGFRGVASVFFTGDNPGSWYTGGGWRPVIETGSGFIRPVGYRHISRGFYWAANSPYLKDLAIGVDRFPKQLDAATAKIPRNGHVDRTSFYFAIDGSGSMFDNPERMNAAKIGMGEVLDYLSGVVASGVDLDIGVCFWGTSVSKVEFKHATVANVATLKAFVQGAPNVGGTDFTYAANAAMAWYNDSRTDTTLQKRIFVFMTDGEPTPPSTADQAATIMADPLDPNSGVFNQNDGTSVQMFGINLVLTDTQYTAKLDNTSVDGVPVVSADDTEGLTQAIFGAVSGGVFDANPAHIIYECLIDTTWGMGESEAGIDKASFTTAANTLYGEGLGISLAWQQESTIEDFVNEVLGHIEGVLFTDPHTGLLTLRLTRGDYDVDTLPVIDADHCTITQFSRKAWGETVNEVKVTWTNPENEQSETVTVQDLGSIATQGALVTTSQNYYGVRSSLLAMKLAARDLRSMSYPISSVEMDLDRSGWALTPMAVVKVRYPEYGLDDLVMRVGNIDYGKPGSGKIHVSLVEDIFSLPFLAYSQPPATQWQDPSVPPAAADEVLIMPAPYFGLAAALGEETPDVASPDTYATVLVAAPNNATFSYDLAMPQTLPNGDTGWGLIETEQPFVAHGLLQASLPAEPSIRMPVLRQDTGEALAVNYLVVFGEPSADPTTYELALVSGFDSLGWPVLQRGILDTVPRRWPVGTPVWYGEPEGFVVDPTPRIDGGTAKYRILTRTALGALALDRAPDETEVMASRASLPFRPADVRLNGIPTFGNTSPGAGYAAPASITLDIVANPNVLLSWANRDRLTEDSQVLAWTDESTQPEAGASNSITVFDKSGTDVLASEDGLTGTSETVALSTAASASPAGVKVCIGAKRGDDVSWVENQCFDIRFGQQGAITNPDAAGDVNGWTLSGKTIYSRQPAIDKPAGVAADAFRMSVSDTGVGWITEEVDIPGENAADNGDVIYDLTAWAANTSFPDRYAYIGVAALDETGAWLGGRMAKFDDYVGRWNGALSYFPVPFGARTLVLSARFRQSKTVSSANDANWLTSLRGHYRNGETNYVLYAGGSNPVAGWSAAGATLATSTPSGDPGWGVPQLDITVGSDSGAATLSRTVDLPTGVLEAGYENTGKIRYLWSAGLSSVDHVAARLYVEYLDGSGAVMLKDYSQSDLAHSTGGETILAEVDTPMEAIPGGVTRVRFGAEVAKFEDTAAVIASLNWMTFQIIDYSGNPFVGDNIRVTESDVDRITEAEALRVVEGGDVDFSSDNDGDPFWGNVVSLLHFDGDENGTDFSDRKGKIWTPHGSPVTVSIPAKFGQAYYSESGGNSLSTPYDEDFDFSTEDWTIDGWVLPQGASRSSTYGTVLSKRVSGGDADFIIFQGQGPGTLALKFGDDSSGARTLSSLQDVLTPGMWTHFEFNRQGDLLRIFVNGKLRNTATLTGPMRNRERPLEIGKSLGYGDSYWIGGIDDLRITKGVARHVKNFDVPTLPCPDF